MGEGTDDVVGLEAVLLERLDAERKYDSAIAELASAIGAKAVETFEPEGLLVPPPAIDVDVNALVARATSERPEARVARASTNVARAEIRAADSQAVPDLSIGVTYEYERDADVTAQTILGSIGIGLPFFNRNQGNVDTAAAEIRVAQANAAATEAIVRAEVRAAGAEYELRRRQVREFLGKFRDAAAETSRIAQAAYRLGGADLLRLLDAERLRIEVELQNERSLMEYRQSIVQLETALGVNP